mgnify:CR=1 FL=1
MNHGTLRVGSPRARAALAPGLLAALVGLAGCETLVTGQVEPALFPAVEAAAVPPLTGRVALELPPAVRERLASDPVLCTAGRARLQLPLGAIVDAALQRQLGIAFTGGAAPAALPLPATSDVAVALSVIELRLVLDRKLNWVVPIPAPPPLFLLPLASSTHYGARLELDLRVSDGLGRVLAQTTVDSGAVVVERGTWSTEPPDQRCLKLTHQAAWQAAAQAVRVLRETLQAERQRERSL